MIDTHTHLYLPEFDSDGGGEAAVNRALDAGVKQMIFPNVGEDTLVPMMALAAQFHENVKCALGLHPTEVNDSWRLVADRIFSSDHVNVPVVAIGEVGIDLYWDTTFKREQIEAFDYQCGVAEQRKLPLIIHCREGLNEVLEVLSAHRDVPAVFHSFGGTVGDVERIREVGDYYFGINGIVTFKNSKVGDTLQSIGINRILLETDSPYLAPVPKRGKRNESAYLQYVRDEIAKRLNLTSEEVAEATTSNAKKLFAL